MSILDAIGREVERRLHAVASEPLVLDHTVEFAVEHLGLVELAARDVDAELMLVMAEDLAHRLGLLPFPGALPRAARVLPRLLAPAAVRGMALAAVSRCPSESDVARLEMPLAAVRARAAALRDIAEQEWEGREPAEVAAGGEELVFACGRLLVGASLVAAGAGGDADIVNAARRYAWRWLRLPLPEAVVPAHLTRTRLFAERYLRREAAMST